MSIRIDLNDVVTAAGLRRLGHILTPEQRTEVLRIGVGWRTAAVAVSEISGFQVDYLMQKRRFKAVMQVRHCLFEVCCQLSRHSSAQVSRKLGIDHATGLNSRLVVAREVAAGNVAVVSLIAMSMTRAIEIAAANRRTAAYEQAKGRIPEFAGAFDRAVVAIESDADRATRNGVVTKRGELISWEGL